jgi:hypothetical protein
MSNKKFLKCSNNELDKKFRGVHKYKPYYMKVNPYRVLNFKNKIKRRFKVGLNKNIEIKHIANIFLRSNEQITFFSKKKRI